MGDHLLIVGFAGSDGIQLVFHPFGVADFHEVEAVTQAIDDRLAEGAWHEETVDRLHIPFAGQGADDGRVGRRTTDTFGFQFFHQSGFTETARRLGLLFEDAAILWGMVVTDTQ